MKYLLLICILFLNAVTHAADDTLFCKHKVVLDDQGKLLPWYKPNDMAYDHFLHLRWNFIKQHVPDAPGPAPRSLYPQYYFYCAFKPNGETLEPDTWMNDVGEKIPNWFESARLYYAYCGDTSVMNTVKGMVDYSMVHGISDDACEWRGFPYTTTNAGDTIFEGFTSSNRFVRHEVQVDHAGEMGLTYLRMYRFFGEKKYLDAAIRVADALVKHMRTGNGERSVWPYRIVTDDGAITAEYGANWTGCYMLLEELEDSGEGDVEGYRKAMGKARDFLLNFPMKTGFWTDGHSDTDIRSNTYKSNLSASNMTLFLFDHPEFDPLWKTDVPSLISWTEEYFMKRSAPGEASTMWGAGIIGEQDAFLYKMDYQTARYAAECARWYAVSGDSSYREKAFRSLNWVTYCNDTSGMAFESPLSKGILSWWSDCYGECPRMFYQAFAGMPELAPPHENHILYSAGIIKNVRYREREITFETTSPQEETFLRLSFKPMLVTTNGNITPFRENGDEEGYTLKVMENGDYFMVLHNLMPGKVRISGREASVSVDGAKVMQKMDGFGVNANTRSWNDGELKPALDLLTDSLHLGIWRVVVETMEKWEEVNDNDDPFTLNSEYYDSLYETPKFRKAWDMIAYLNSKGIRQNLMLNLMGPIPAWMGDSIVLPEYEDEYVETLVSFLDYAKNKEHLSFGLFGPMNEPDIRKEGPTVGPVQYAAIIRKLIERMNMMELKDIRLVIPDVANMNTAVNDYLTTILDDPIIMEKVARIGMHSYSGYYGHLDEKISESAWPETGFWMTEFNDWREGLDDGVKGVYNYEFARDCFRDMTDLIDHGASACMVWEGYDSYYEHHAPSLFSYWGILGYEPENRSYTPRKHFYALAQLSKFVTSGSRHIAVSNNSGSIPITAFYDPASRRFTLSGINNESLQIELTAALKNLPDSDSLTLYYTDATHNLSIGKVATCSCGSLKAELPPACIFTITGILDQGIGTLNAGKPEQKGWYAGDMHVHRNCGIGRAVVAESSLPVMMERNDLSVISLLADMGNAEVQDSKTDLPKVTGRDALFSTPGRIVHYDAEWHFDPAGVTFERQAIGGHLVILGLTSAKQIWAESPYKIIRWAKKQDAVVGFCHMEYLSDGTRDELTCCIPLDYPVETALGTIDFLSEDVWLNDAAIHAYYRLLNCGFRPSWAAGTDYPCNSLHPLGTQLTYVNVRDKPISYKSWIEGIREGRTVVSMHGHSEFLDLKAGGEDASPGDEIRISSPSDIDVSVVWTATEELAGAIEIICNGKVIDRVLSVASSGKPVEIRTSVHINESSWICARRMNDAGHQVHTSAIFVTLNDQPVRASEQDALYFIRRIDELLENTSPGGNFVKYFPHDLKSVRKRYMKARKIYEKIAAEAHDVKQ